ncbi:peptidoglycan-recognition protein LC isoform X2 [Stomoxys calcitrans]|uniref:peptidoglycan-recognition protein LC isoform X2 n=1 Tax=Stomoxys calcitrans TaxID=35570 RepID=UPI0027E2BABC|nr:peptidoglycan-recognition protein LC isoform X2 [Stomoxys calcitrans]
MEKMHLNVHHIQQLQEQTQQSQQRDSQYDFIQTDDKTSSLSSDESNTEITATSHKSDIDNFAGSEASCTSSTDSGVHGSDNENPATTAPPSPLPRPQPKNISHSSTKVTVNPLWQHQLHLKTKGKPSVSGDNKSKNNNKPKAWSNSDANEREHTGRSCNRPFDNKFAKIEKHLKSGRGDENNSRTPHTSNRNAIEIENVIANGCAEMMEEQKSALGPRFNDPSRAPSPAPSSIISSSSADTLPNKHPPSHHHCNQSPAMSIRSIDSSIIDSDSELDENGEAEGVHKNYVIKKLGTQVSYPPKHPDIPVINRGLTVLNQKITPNVIGPPPPAPLAVLTNLGDSLGLAHSLSQVPIVRPQVAISSSSDVTIGDKHFYEGPVTIQQFLIDNRNKSNEGGGKDNVVFVDDDGVTRTNAKDINSTPAASDATNVNFLRRKKLIIAGSCAVIALVVVAIIAGIEASTDNKSKIASGNSEESRKNIPINSTIDIPCSEGHLCLISRETWGHREQKKKLDPQNLPLHRVVIAHTASTPCDSLETCSDRVREIQNFHMDSFKWDDIGYNFLIGSDGRVYMGRGWDDVGAVVKGYNYDSVGIAFIGTFVKDKPTEAQLNACRLLLDEGVRLKKLVPDYILNGARQLSATESPGDALYYIIRKWPNWSANIQIKIS